MFWPAKEDYYLGSYSELCEQQLKASMRDAEADILRIDELKNSDAWDTAQKIARDFENTYHQVKSTDKRGIPIPQNILLNYSIVDFSHPKLNVPIMYPSGQMSEIELDLSQDISSLYYDIQPASTLSSREDGTEFRYFGAHLLGLVNFEFGITLDNGTELPADTYPFYMPFKDVRVSQNHRSGIYN
jgi:hypothetical protein